MFSNVTCTLSEIEFPLVGDAVKVNESVPEHGNRRVFGTSFAIPYL